jgi:hypothetical protein
MNKGKGPEKQLEARVVGTRRIRSGGNVETRAVVELPACFNGKRSTMEFTLGARTGLNYRVILGRRSLEGAAVVDPQKKFTTEGGCPP